MAQRSIREMLAECGRAHLLRPPACVKALAHAASLGLPDDLLEFYAVSDGACFHACDHYAGLREVDGRWWRWELEPIGKLKTIAEDGYILEKSPLFEQSKMWIRFLNVQDGDCLAVCTASTERGRILDCFHETVGNPNCNKIIALSFAEVLAKLVDSPDSFWLNSGFKGYGYV